jgi:superfamily I DNA and/or RNA helicase
MRGPIASSIYEKGAVELAIWEELIQSSPGDSHVHVIVDIVDQWLIRLTQVRDLYPAVIADANVIAGTCLGFLSVPGSPDLTFDLAIIDEASKATPTELLVPMSRARRAVLVGDPKQLPPYIESGMLEKKRLEDWGLAASDVTDTLFSRLEAFLPKGAVEKLTIQYRMAPAIGNLVREVFYPGVLENGQGDNDFPTTLRHLNFPKDIVWSSTSRLRSKQESAGDPSFSNAAEVGVIKDILSKLGKSTRRAKINLSVVLLTPYGEQRMALERELAGLKNSLTNLSVEAHTVHTYQGREADITIFSAVRSNPLGKVGFATEALLNVAVSRCHVGLIVVGDLDFLERAKAPQGGDPPPYRELIRYFRSHPETCSIVEERE